MCAVREPFHRYECLDCRAEYMYSIHVQQRKKRRREKKKGKGGEEGKGVGGRGGRMRGGIKRERVMSPLAKQLGRRKEGF